MRPFLCSALPIVLGYRERFFENREELASTKRYAEEFGSDSKGKNGMELWPLFEMTTSALLCICAA